MPRCQARPNSRIWRRTCDDRSEPIGPERPRRDRGLFQIGTHAGPRWNRVCTRSVAAGWRARQSRYSRRCQVRPPGQVRPRGFARGRRLRAMAKDQHDLSGAPAKPGKRTPAMKLREILDGVGTVAIAGSLDAEIRAVVCDSRKAQPGALFFALHGSKADGNRFISDAIERGATAVASEDVRPNDAPRSIIWVQLKRDSARRGLASAAANFFHHPASALKLVGITGTNGKDDRIISDRFHPPRRRPHDRPHRHDRLHHAARAAQSREHHARIGGLAGNVRGSARCRRLGRSARNEFARAGDGSPLGTAFRRSRFYQSHARSSEFPQDDGRLFRREAPPFRRHWCRRAATSIINIDDAYGKRLHEEISKRRTAHDDLWPKRSRRKSRRKNSRPASTDSNSLRKLRPAMSKYVRRSSAA